MEINMDFESISAVEAFEEELNKKSKPPLVVYHSPCLDGYTAAWAAWLKYPDAEFHPGVYGEPPPDVTDRDVYLLDFSYKRAVMLALMETAHRIVILDHHKSAEADLAGLDELPHCKANVYVYFDMDKSGARLAWEYFHSKETVPLLVRYVEDRDLWRFALQSSREVNAVLFSYDYDFATWNVLCARIERAAGFASLHDEGEAILRKQDKDVRELVAKTRHTATFTRMNEAEPAVVPAINLPYVFASDAGNLLAEGAPFAAVYYYDGKAWNFSLRSKEGCADVSEIASLYGGGGHKHAAGFRVKSLEEL